MNLIQINDHNISYFFFFFFHPDASSSPANSDKKISSQEKPPIIGVAKATTKKKYRCPYCRWRFDNFSRIRRHVKRHKQRYVPYWYANKPRAMRRKRQIDEIWSIWFVWWGSYFKDNGPNSWKQSNFNSALNLD